ncbi:MAG: DNA gyrase C-terminal beta-propeller domain-containing protein, partial [Oscillospiraceae bacterium]|nr:DNA gyrase C-terminal beta-propeller domain-containing protein [Oscillospiraceae bacterium]
RVYTIKSYTIPEGSRQSRGTNIVNILPLLPGEKISSVLKIDDFNDESKYLVMVTKNGVVKRSSLSLFQKIRKTGIYGIELDEGDELAWARVTSGDDHLLVATKYGMAIRFRETDARSMGRTTRGVRAITLKEGDEVVGMAIATSGKILTVTDQGKGRLTPVENYHLQKRGGLGARNYDCADGTMVAGVRLVDEFRDDAILISENGTVIRMHVDTIATQSRYGGGVRVMRVDEGDRVVTVACTLRDDLDDDEILEGALTEQPIAAPSEDEIEEMLSRDLKEEE